MRGLIAVAFYFFMAFAAAYQILVPSGEHGWTNNGSQPLEWVQSPADRANFTLILLNPGLGVNQSLDALVVGSLQNTTVNPPSAGWTTGTGFFVQFVQDTQDQGTILANSTIFSITTPNTTATTTALTGPPQTPVVIQPSTTSDLASGATAAGAADTIFEQQNWLLSMASIAVAFFLS